MHFANPWGLLGLLALPAIVALHLFVQRFPPLLVAGAHLWGAETRISDAGRRRDRLPLTPSLLLELLAALLLTVALSEPRFGDLGEVGHLVVVLDDSASMLARSGNEPSFRDLALAELERQATALGRGARVTLIRTGVHPTLLGTRAAAWTDAQRAAADWRPQSPRHDPQPAWDEALQIVGKQGRFLFLTDDMPQPADELPPQMEAVAVGRRLDNLAIAAARWSFDPETSQGAVFFRIANYGARDATAKVNGRSGDQVVFEQTLNVPAGGETPLETPVPGGLGRITIALASAGDGLETDNTVTLIEPQVRSVTLAVTLPADSPERRLTEKVLAVIPEIQHGPAEAAHLLIAPAGELPPSRRDLWWLGIGPVARSTLLTQQARDLLGPYLIERQHPLVDGVTLGGVIWGGVQGTDLGLTPVISAGNVPLLSQLQGTQTTAYLMNIDLGRSNLGESPDWPILVNNLVELRRQSLPGLQRWNYRVNEQVRFRLPPQPANAADLMLIEPGGRRRTLVRDRNDFVEIAGVEQTGVYRIQEGNVSQGTFAVSFFDADESTLTRLTPGRHAPTVDVETARLRLDNPYSWLLILSILLIVGSLLADWRIVRAAPRAA